MYENGTDFWSGGIEYHGDISLGGNWWIAFVKGDEGMVLRIVHEDVVLGD